MPSRPAAAPGGAERLLAAVSRHPVLVVLGYFLVQSVLRLAVSPELGQDDGEQMILTQLWAWGYGSQPPLYTWLAKAAFAILGPGPMALVLLKNAFLAATWLAVYATGVRLLGSRPAAATAALSLMLVPQIAWESQRALSHTVLVVAVAACTLLAFVTLLERRRPLDHIVLGLLLGAGLLSKLNFLYFALALWLAAISLPDLRRTVCGPWMLATAGTAILVSAPTAVWMALHPAAVGHRVGKFAIGAGDGPLETLAMGLGSLALNTVAFLALLVVVYAVATWRAPAAPPPRPWAPVPAPYARPLLVRAALAGLLLVALSVALSGTTTVKDRWLQPLLFFTPLAAVALARTRLPARRMAVVAALGAGIAVLVAVGLPARILLAGAGGKIPTENLPYGTLAREIRDRLGFSAGTIITDGFAEAGNLALGFPGASVLIPEYTRLGVPTPGPVLLVWRSPSDAVPDDLAATFAARFGAPPPAGPGVALSAPVHFRPDLPYTVRALVVRSP